MTENLLAVYMFGSLVRGDGDQHSDLDLLAVVKDGGGKLTETCVTHYVPLEYSKREPSISWYGKNRLSQMFRNGELFAWHLHNETTPLFEREPVISMLGKPTKYQGAVEDVTSFQKVLSGIPTSIRQSPENAIYELGLVYVCLRNICMSASSVLCAQVDFSRYSPFNLVNVPPVPITKHEFDLAMSCRMAGQRGIVPPSNIVTSEMVTNIYYRLAPWIETLRASLEKHDG